MVRHRVEELRQLAPVGQAQPRIELEQRLEHEAPARDLGVRERQALRFKLELAEQENVHVDRPRPVTNAGGRPAQLALDVLADIEQALGIERGLDAHAGVEEIGLVGHFALGRRLVDRGGRDRFDPASGESLSRSAQVRQAVAFVGAQAEVALPAQTSFQTSTETSSTGNAIGGSGLAALTRTDSAPKRSIIRSATAVHRRSRVL